MRRRAGTVVVGGLGLLTLAIPSAAFAATESPKGWAKGFCASTSGWSDDVETLVDGALGPDSAAPLGASEAQSTLATLLKKMTKRTDKLATAVRRGGTPDVKNGAGVVRVLADQLAAAADAMREVRTQVRTAPVDDPDAFALAIALANAEMQNLLTAIEVDLTGEGLGGRALQKAVAKIPACRDFVDGET